MEDDYGSTETVLLAQEAKLQQIAEENRLLGAAADSLQQQLKAAQGQASAAQKRAAEVEARLRAKPAAAVGEAGGDSQQLSNEVDRLKRRAANDRILLEQAERGRQEASSELSAARQEAAQLGQQNVDLQQRLAAAQRQVRQLESLQSFADSWDEQQQREQELTAALAQANGRVGQLEGRCASLERDLGQAAAALQAAQQLAAAAAEGSQDRRQEQCRGRPDHQHQQAQRVGSLSLSDLCDLEGALSQFEAAGDGSPQRSSVLGGGGSGGLPSRQRALQQQQRQYQAEQQRRRRVEQEQGDQGDAAEAAAAGQEVHPSLAASLQQQLLEQQRQLAILQLQQQMHASGNQACGQQQQAQGGGQSSQLAAPELEVEKLKRRNTQLQTALAEASLQHARAAAAGQRQLAELQQAAAQLQQQRDEAQQQLAQLQAAATALGLGEAGVGGSDRGFGGCSSEQLEELHGELLEYAGRCNAAVEQNSALIQEKKQWLEKLRGAEAEVERCRAEAQQLRLQHLQLTSSSGGSSSALGGGGGGGTASCGDRQQQELLQRLLEAQAGEAALRSVLGEARDEQVAACKALSGELRRVQALERLRISDVQEVQRLQRRLHDMQRDCQQLARSLAAAQQQQQQAAAAPGGKRGPVHASSGGADFQIAAFAGGRPN